SEMGINRESESTLGCHVPLTSRSVPARRLRYVDLYSRRSAQREIVDVGSARISSTRLPLMAERRIVTIGTSSEKCTAKELKSFSIPVLCSCCTSKSTKLGPPPPPRSLT